MITTFACKRISLEQIIRCSFELNKTEYKIFSLLLKNKDMSVKEISRKLGLTRTSVQKAIKTLLNKSLVRRFQRNLSGGGYQYIYNLNDKQKIKLQIKKILDSWCNSVQKIISKL